MTLTIRSLLLLVAVILFLAAAVGYSMRDFSLQSLGLAFFAAAFIVPERTLGRRR